ncbi:MAG: NAD(P)-dependent alcohol dehydrogenase [Gammaproteobacteria bacterium]|nr:NAD(P)-dependent alcohol dehydrogenase [Gammaproteobacteria bacterium]
MKAFTYSQYGSAEVLKLSQIPKPTPKDNEVLVKVEAVSVNAADWRMMKADPFLVRLGAGLFKPKKDSIPGADISGRVEAVGKNVRQFKPGDEVFGETSGNGFGGFAEYKCAKETELVLKPANLTFEQAAAVPMAGLTALHTVRDVGNVQAGQKVLINGASGGVGTFAVQLAKYYAAEVTAVCSTSKLEQARALGADHVIDYTKEDFTRNGNCYDIVFGLNGFRSIFDYRRILCPNGRYVMTGGNSAQLFQALLLGPLLSIVGKRKVSAVFSKSNQQNLQFLGEMLASGKLKVVIDKRFQFDEVPEAIRYVQQGHAKGKVVITVGTRPVD